MNNFNLFRTKMKNELECFLKQEASFITDSTASTMIFNCRTEEEQSVALTLNDKEGPDTAIIFSSFQTDKEKELLKTDYFKWKDLIYFVYEDIKIVRDAIYKKQKAYQCNVHFVLNEKEYYGYYVSSLGKYIDTTLEQSLNITENSKPVLILPLFDGLEIGLKIIIKETPYKIIDFDLITNEGIAYISLARDFIDKQENIEEIMPIQDSNVLKAGIEIELPIEWGYFYTEPKVELVSKSIKEVRFIIPYGVNNLKIYSKDLNKQNIIREYKVVY